VSDEVTIKAEGGETEVVAVTVPDAAAAFDAGAAAGEFRALAEEMRSHKASVDAQLEDVKRLLEEARSTANAAAGTAIAAGEAAVAAVEAVTEAPALEATVDPESGEVIEMQMPDVPVETTAGVEANVTPKKAGFHLWG
jgi:hypothetical protein